MAVTRHQRRVFTFARYLLANHEEAEDVAQEVFLRLWRSDREIEPERLETWLLRVARNAGIDRLRRRSVTRRLFASEPVNPAAEPVCGRNTNPEVLAMASEYSHQLSSAIANLGEPQRSIVILREIQGLSYSEIAGILDIKLNTVRVRLHRARRQLREQLREVYLAAS